MQASSKQASLCKGTLNALLIFAYCTIEAESVLGSQRASAVLARKTAGRGLKLSLQSRTSRSNESHAEAVHVRSQARDPDIMKEIRTLEEELAKKIHITDKLHKDIKKTHHEVVANLKDLDAVIAKLHLEFKDKEKVVRDAIFDGEKIVAIGAEMFALELDERDSRMASVTRDIGTAHSDSLLIEDEMVATAEQAQGQSMFVHGFVTMMADEMSIKLAKLEAAARERRSNVGKVDETLQATIDELHKTIGGLTKEEALLQDELAHLQGMKEKDINAKKTLIDELKEAIQRLGKDSGLTAGQLNARRRRTAEKSTQGGAPAQKAPDSSNPDGASSQNVQKSSKQASTREQKAQDGSKQADAGAQNVQKNSKQASTDEQKTQDGSKKADASAKNVQKNSKAASPREQKAQDSSKQTGTTKQSVQEKFKQARKQQNSERVQKVQDGSEKTSNQSSTANTSSSDVIGRVWVRPAKPLQQFGLATEP